MEKEIRYTLGKNERLKSRKAIEQLFKKGRSFSAFPLKVIYILEETNDIELTPDKIFLQAGFSVSGRNFKKAVDRNRIKRLMREAYRLQKINLQQQLISANKKLTVFFLYTGKEVPEHDLIFLKKEKALKQLQKILHESNTANN